MLPTTVNGTRRTFYPLEPGCMWKYKINKYHRISGVKPKTISKNRIKIASGSLLILLWLIMLFENLFIRV